MDSLWFSLDTCAASARGMLASAIITALPAKILISGGNDTGLGSLRPALSLGGQATAWEGSPGRSFCLTMSSACGRLWQFALKCHLIEEIGFPGGSVMKNLPANADVGLIPGSGRSLGEGNGNPLQCSCLENPRDGALR